MNHGSSSPVQEYSPPKADSDELTPVMDSQDHQVDRESSSDEIPLRKKRPLRASTQDRENSYDLRDRRQLQKHMGETNDVSLLEQRRNTHQATLLKPPKTVAKSTGKTPKKPGPRPWASKPIKKNDMEAKKEVIQEIEKYWGKGFIKAYIPKCHRPLVKRGKGGKRAMYRDHETDPKKWLPSVLKAILMIARLTHNSSWLRKAMDDVVRYRIKNTGNRKPQLVTTDFDVLEDVLVKDWDVAYSFSIRYKHLLVNLQGQQETDENIDHILGIESGEEDDCDDEVRDEVRDDVKGGSIGGRDDGEVDDEDDNDGETCQGGLNGQYLHTTGYTNALQYPQSYPMPGLPPRQYNVKQERGSKRLSELRLRPQLPPHSKTGQQGFRQPHPYGPPFDPWGRPMPYAGFLDEHGRYGGYGMYGGCSGYGPPPHSNSRHEAQPLGYYGMDQYHPPHQATTPAPRQPDTDYTVRKHSQDPPCSGNKRQRNNTEQHPFHTGRPSFQPHGYPQSLQGGHPAVKQEPLDFEPRGEEYETSVDDVEGPTTNLSEDSNAAALEAELRATQLELKVARLQAKRAALTQQSRAR